MDIGKKIRALRGNMNQAELAKRAQVDKAIISKIENGKMSGTVDCHGRIAAVFGMKLSQFYAYLEEDKLEPAQLHLASAKTDMYQDFLEILTSIPLSKKMLPTIITLKAGQEQILQETLKEVERFLLVLEGKIHIEIEDKIYNLNKDSNNEKGDSLYSLSLKEHIIKNVGQAQAKILCVSCPPVL